MNKLIILLILNGSLKGGAQRRYINLFKELQKTRDDYYLLLNKSLYKACIANGIFDSDKNIIILPVKYEQDDNTVKNRQPAASLSSKCSTQFRAFLGRNKYFLKQIHSWIIYNIDLYRILRKYKIKTIYGIYTGGIWSWTLAKLLRVKFIYSYMDASVYMISKKWIRFLSSEYWPIKYANKVDFLSKNILISLRRKIGHFDNAKVLITPNSFIDYNRFFSVNPKKPLVVFCSRLTRFKNPDLLLDSLLLLQKRGVSNFEVAIIGEGPLLYSLETRVAKHELSNITFYGGIPNPELILGQSSIFISIQSDNNYPSQSLIEAMACENSIIASDVGETRMLVTENEGILVSLNAERIADAIEFLIFNPDECERLGKNARKKVLKEHSIERFLDYFQKITKT